MEDLDDTIVVPKLYKLANGFYIYIIYIYEFEVHNFILQIVYISLILILSYS